MQRRNFFKSLVGRSAAAAAVAGATVVAAKAPAQTILPHQLEVQGADYLRWKSVPHHGARLDIGPYKVVWTGWKSYPEVDRLCGQWLGRPRGRSLHSFNETYLPGHDYGLPNLYASYPGYAGVFLEGDAFPTGALRGQVWLTSTDPEEEFEHAQWETYVLLHKIIKEYDWKVYGQLNRHEEFEVRKRIAHQAEEFWQRFEVRNPHR